VRLRWRAAVPAHLQGDLRKDREAFHAEGILPIDRVEGGEACSQGAAAGHKAGACRRLPDMANREGRLGLLERLRDL
jgi:hypothetical protein